MSFILSRQQLYDLAWSYPRKQLSKQIGISDVAITKACKKASIIVPERGYWAKRKSGKNISKIPLMPRDLSISNHVAISGNRPETLKSHTDSDIIEELQSEDVAVLTERFAKRLGHVVVPRNFDFAHPIIKKLLEKDEEIRQKKATEQYYWHEPKFETPFERRRLRIISAIFSAFAKVGCRGWISGDGASDLGVKIGAMTIGFTVDSPSDRRHERLRRPTSNSISSEKLSISINAYSPPLGLTLVWTDEQDSLLEKRMTEVVVGMAVAAEYLHRESIRRHIVWERERREAAEREEIRRRKEAELQEQERIAAMKKARIDALLADAESLERAALLRSYVDSVLALQPVETTYNDLKIWAGFVRQQADALDPLTSGRLKKSIMEALAEARVSEAIEVDCTSQN